MSAANDYQEMQAKGIDPPAVGTIRAEVESIIELERVNYEPKPGKKPKANVIPKADIPIIKDRRRP